MKKRLLCILLALALTSGSLVSCSDNAPEENPDAAPSAAEETVDPAEIPAEEELSDYELRQLIPDNLPEKDLGGWEFRIAVPDGAQAKNDYLSEIVVEEFNGDVCNDAVYRRNVTVEDRFGFKITCDALENVYTYPQTMAMSGTADYHMVGMYNYMSCESINALADLNWHDVPYVDMSQPWHNKLANDDATVNGYLYTICSDLSTTSMTFSFAIFVNLDLISNYGYSPSDLYGLVKEGKWTIDYFSDLVSKLYVDVNGNGKEDADDQYGYGGSMINGEDVWYTAFGEHITGRDENGHIIMTFMTEKTSSVVEKLVDLYNNNPGGVIFTKDYEEETSFLNSKLVMAPLRFQTAYTVLRDMDSPYTMLPYPKWDEAQTAYYTNADDKFETFVLPTTSLPEVESIGLVFEALSAESYKSVYPAYYDTALKGKYSTDAETADMVDLIMSGRLFDFSFQFANTVLQRVSWMVRDSIKANDVNIASRYKKVEKIIEKGMEKTFSKAFHYDE